LSPTKLLEMVYANAQREYPIKKKLLLI